MNESLCKAAQQHGYGDPANESTRQVNSALAGQAEAARGGFEAGASRLKFE